MNLCLGFLAGSGTLSPLTRVQYSVRIACILDFRLDYLDQTMETIDKKFEFLLQIP